jgi:hypothetical protein
MRDTSQGPGWELGTEGNRGTPPSPSVVANPAPVDESDESSGASSTEVLAILCRDCGYQNDVGSEFCANANCRKFLKWTGEPILGFSGSGTAPKDEHSSVAAGSVIQDPSNAGPSTVPDIEAIPPAPRIEFHPPPPPTQDTQSDEIGLVCPECHTPNSQSRTLCRNCGTALPLLDSGSPPTPEPVAKPVKSQRSGSVGRFRPLVKNVAAALIVAVALVFALVPTARHTLVNFFHPTYARVSVYGLTTSPSSSTCSAPEVRSDNIIYWYTGTTFLNPQALTVTPVAAVAEIGVTVEPSTLTRSVADPETLQLSSGGQSEIITLSGSNFLARPITVAKGQPIHIRLVTTEPPGATACAETAIVLYAKD